MKISGFYVGSKVRLAIKIWKYTASFMFLFGISPLMGLEVTNTNIDPEIVDAYQRLFEQNGGKL